MAEDLTSYSWTSLPKGAPLRDEMPYVTMTGGRPKYGAFKQYTNGYLNAGGSNAGDGDAFYTGLYQIEGTEAFKFPYFGSALRHFQNNFADAFSQVSQRGTQALGADAMTAAGDIAEFAGSGFALANEMSNSFRAGKSPGSYLETPKFYQFENTDTGLNIDFILSNTVEEGDATKNSKFIRKFTELNRPERTGAQTMKFPYIYNKIRVPGQRYIEWAYLADFSVELLGARRMIDGELTPEAYGIHMTFQSLTMEHSGFMKKA